MVFDAFFAVLLSVFLSDFLTDFLKKCHVLLRFNLENDRFYVFGMALFFTVLLCFVIFPQHGASGYNPQRTNLKRNKESDFREKK